MKKRILALALSVMLAVCGCALAEGRTLTVRGAGEVRLSADRALVSLGVREVRAEVMEAQAAVNERIGAVTERLIGLGIEPAAISTDGIGLYPNYDYDSGEERVTGYVAYNTLRVAVDADRVGEVIDAAFEAGANSLDYVDFSASQDVQARNAALALAVADAMEKAQVLAEAAHVTLGDIVSLSEDAGGMVVGYARSEEADAGAGTVVYAGGQTVSASVTVVFKIAGTAE